MPRPFKWGILGSCIIILSQDIHQNAGTFHGFLKFEKIGKTGESSKNYFPAFLWIFLDIWQGQVTLIFAYSHVIWFCIPLLEIQNNSSSGPTYDNVATGSSSHDQVNVIGIYAQKNKTLESEVKTLSVELTKAKEMLKNVEKYWSHQVINYLSTSLFKNSCYPNVINIWIWCHISQKAMFLWPSQNNFFKEHGLGNG